MPPSELRGAVLRDMERELRAARWDRRLGRVAVLLLVVGVGLNASLSLHVSTSPRPRPGQMAVDGARDSLIETAIVVAEATDVETGRRFARQLAAMSGRELTDQELAAIGAATDPNRG